MLIPFAASSAILWITLAFTVWLSSVMPPILQSVIRWEWLISIATGSIAGIVVGRTYGVLIDIASRRLPKPITPANFLVASLTMVCLVLAAALRIHIELSQQFSEIAVLFGLAVVVLGTVESWSLFPKSIPLMPRLMFAGTAGFAVFSAAVLVPIYTIEQFVNYYNAGFASCVAGWSAGLLSRELMPLFRRRRLEATLGESVFGSLIAREVPVLMAATLAYIAFKFGGFSPILFSMAVGAGSAIVGSLLVNISVAD